MFSSFLSDFEEFISEAELKELENIAGYKRIKEIGDNSHPKFQFLNQGVNSKELMLFFLWKTIEKSSRDISGLKKDITMELMELFKQYSHSRIRWKLNSSNSKISVDIEFGNKRQLSVKSLGTYYTPNFMSNFMTRNSIEHISRQKLDNLKNYIKEIEESKSQFNTDTLHEFIAIKIVDLSMGIGNFLCDAIPYLITHLKSCKDILHSRLWKLLSKQDQDLLQNFTPFCFIPKNQLENSLIGKFIFKECLYGIEVDPNIHKMAQIIVELKLSHLLEIEPIHPSNLYCKNSIITPLKKLFPSIFCPKLGGFDIIIGNPPWEILKPNKREFFSNYHPNFLRLTRREQDIVQNKLLQNKYLSKLFTDYTNQFTLQMKSISSLNYSYLSSNIKGKVYAGDPQLFKIFLEIAFKGVRQDGIITLVVQHNLLGSKSCAALRSLYLKNGKFEGIWEFYNKTQEKLIFKNVDPNLRFIVFQFKKKMGNISSINYKKCRSTEDLASNFLPFQKIPIDLFYKVSDEEYQLFGFNSIKERQIFEKIISTDNNFSTLHWIDKELKLFLAQDLHVTRDRKKFSSTPTSISVYGGKNFGPYYSNEDKHRFLKENKSIRAMDLRSSLVCRNILPNSTKRIIFSVTPPDILVDNSCTRLFFEPGDLSKKMILLGIANSLLVEYFLRTILTGINLNYYLLQRIPLPSKTVLNSNKGARIISKFSKIVQEILATPLETEEWARNYAKIEVLTALLFNLTKEELSVVLDTFDFNKLKQTKLSGYKVFTQLTKKAILNYYEIESSRLT